MFRDFHPFHALSSLITHVQAEHGDAAATKVTELLQRVMAANIPWLQILTTLAPFFIAIATGGTVDLPALLAALAALLGG